MSIQQVQSQMRALDATLTSVQRSLADLPAMLGAPALPPNFLERRGDNFFDTTAKAFASLRQLLNRPTSHQSNSQSNLLVQ